MKNELHLTPLHFACESGSAPIIQALCRSGAPLNARDIDGQTPLHVAAFHRHLKTVKYLLKKGCNPNIADNDGATPLHLASWAGEEAIMAELIAFQAEVNAVDQDGATSVMLAAEQGNLACVRTLVEAGADMRPDMVGETPFHKCALQNKTPVLSYLIDNNTSEWTHQTASENKHTPLMLAAKLNRLETAKLLLRAGACIDETNDEGETALHLAANGGFAEMIELLLKKNASIDIQTKEGNTALHLAAISSHSEAVSKLCDMGATPGLQDNNGFTPLALAVQHGFKQLVNKLLLHMANNEISLPDNKGFTVLHHAASFGNDDILKALLEFKCFSIDAETINEWTALLLALNHRHMSTAKILVAHGATTTFGKLAKRKLRNVPRTELAEMLQDLENFSTSRTERATRSEKLSIKEVRRRSQGSTTSATTSTSEKKRGPLQRQNTSREKSGSLLDTRTSGSSKVLDRRVSIYGLQKPKNTLQEIYSAPHFVEAAGAFTEDPDAAIEALVDADKMEDNCTTVAEFLFYTEDLDKTVLGDYLSKKYVNLYLARLITSVMSGTPLFWLHLSTCSTLRVWKSIWLCANS